MINDKSICICIPARFGAKRFPGKPLAMISGTPMVIKVALNMKTSKLADQVIILTDDVRIVEVAEQFGCNAILTNSNHNSGTERIVEFAGNSDFEIFVNVQGDEPFVKGSDIDEFIQKAFEGNSQIATPISEIDSSDELFNFNVVKCVISKQNTALYFSRQAIPAHRELPFNKWLKACAYYKHIGIYYYTQEALNRISKMPVSQLEKTEQLEQLKWLDHNHEIYCIISNIDNFSVDTPEDLKKINQFPFN